MKTASLHGGNVVIFNTSVVSSSSSIDLSQWRGLVICELRTGEQVICELTCELGR